MQTVLVGAVESTEVTLRAMVDEGHPPAAVMTLPLQLSHRHSDFKDLRPFAQRHGIPLVEVRNSNDPDSLNVLKELAPDLVWVVGWSQLCGPEFLSAPRNGAIGYHPSRLPENRGRAVIPWTILQEADSTASTLFWLGQGMDDGEIISQEGFFVAPDETAESLIRKHMEVLDGMVRDVVRISGPDKIPSIPQDHSRATYCARRSMEDGLIDWKLPAKDIWRFIRAVGRPYPGAFTFLNGAQLTIWAAECVGPLPIWATPGQIVQVEETGFLVQCGDREHIRVSDHAFVTGGPRIVNGHRLRDSRAGILT